VGSQPDQFQRFRIRYPVNEHQIRFDMAVAMVCPFAGQRVVAEFFRQRMVYGKKGDHCQQIHIQSSPVLSFLKRLVRLIVRMEIG